MALCEKEGKKRLADLPIEQMRAACEKIENEVYSVLNPAGVCKNYKTLGAAGPENARAQIRYWKEKIKEQ